MWQAQGQDSIMPCYSYLGTLKFSGKGQGRAIAPKARLAGSACRRSRSMNSRNRKTTCFSNLCEEIVDCVFADGKNTKENNLGGGVGVHTMRYLDTQFFWSVGTHKYTRGQRQRRSQPPHSWITEHLGEVRWPGNEESSQDTLTFFKLMEQ